MKKHLLTGVVVLLCLTKIQAQKTLNDSLTDFDYGHFKGQLSQKKDKTERENYLNKIQRNYLKRKYDLVKEPVNSVARSASSSCGNLDFEGGNTAGWAIAGDYQLMSGTAVDPFGGFPVVGPGGNFSLRLNDNNTSCSGPNKKVNFKASAINYISITPSNTNVKVNFAGATLAFPHPTNASAYIKIEFTDINNIPILTPTYSVLYASPPNTVVATNPTTNSLSAIQGAQVCSSVGNYGVYYFPWQTQSFNLSSYVGQTIKIKLTADWCLYDYDWAYAYFDVCCDSTCNVYSSIATTNFCYSKPYQTSLCSNNPFNTNFQWSSSSSNTTSCEYVNSIGSYTLTSNPLGNPTFTVNEIFNFYPTPKVNFNLPVSNACSNSSSGIPLFASPPGGTFSGPGVTTSSFDPWLVGNGTYTITYNYTDSISGCSASATQTIFVTTCTGIQPQIKQTDLIVAPNPFNSELFIRLKDVQENCEFILFNAIGQEIIRKRLSDGKNTIETEGIPQGLYFYSIEQQNKPIKQGKLVKD